MDVLSLAKRPKGMGYGDYLGKCSAMKKSAMPEEEFNALPEEDDDDDAKKSEGGQVDLDALAKGILGSDDDDDDDAGVPVSDLMKALADYDSVEGALGDVTESRTDYLEARLDAGTISKAEKVELGKLWSKAETDDGGDALVKGKTIQERIEADPAAGELLDASPMLKSMVQTLEDRLGMVDDTIRKSAQSSLEIVRAQGGLIKALVSHVDKQDSVLNAMGQRLGVMERTPGQPRSVTADPRAVQGRTLAKGGTAGAPADGLSKSQVISGFQTLMKAASEKGDDPAMEQIEHAGALYETSGRLPVHVEKAIRTVLAR